ncbi:PDR/VanB family oxidoreductase [Noviherbaspirillum sp. Root189]|uniref:PDR/VanB family oxidoreductase n=1 Tax=Noviherbaspirillum sp. Root189 TaxID=1736487 RepID=UPI000710D4A4|nr:PDR/VanB family oxidoreductase [Noviherbaspirillum sp. Root189]KRB93545.1 Vanillate O-demethylase oxidoreductase [Noviherbaspirillum sp. Root189]
MSTMEVRVIRKRVEAEDIASFELSSLDGSPLPAFSAGSHIDVHAPGGVIRQYSLCNDPGETHRYLIAVLRDPASRGGSVAMHDSVQEGDVIQISAPRNHFSLVPAQRSLLLAGGIGVTPILCMAERLAKTGADFEMHYCTRSPERTAFIDRIRKCGFAGAVQFHHDSGPAEQKLDMAQLLRQCGPETHLYVCGPGGFIEHVTKTAEAQGWGKDRIHFEYFAAAPVDTSGDQAFEVTIASTGRTILIPSDKSVAQVLEDEGMSIPVSCEQGVCGTCITRVLGGVPDHRDMYFTDDEKAKNDQFTPCCSRARSGPLVLDL